MITLLALVALIILGAVFIRYVLPVLVLLLAGCIMVWLCMIAFALGAS